MGICHNANFEFLSYLLTTFRAVFRQEIEMSRFFFHLASKKNNILDTNGREFSDLATAHRHAVQLINKMILLGDVDWQGWSINVTDANGRSVLSVLFAVTLSPIFIQRKLESGYR
jgi:hypothetical protein